MKIMPEFADILRSANDDEMLSDAPTDTEEVSDVPCPLDKLFAEAELGSLLGPGRSGPQHAHNLAVELAPLHSRVAAHYKKLADAAKVPATPAVAAGGNKLEKRSDPKNIYREFFTTGIAAGKTAPQVLDAWLSEFPFAAPDVRKLMREACAEFA
jgi:hypothetical protein